MKCKEVSFNLSSLDTYTALGPPMAIYDRFGRRIPVSRILRDLARALHAMLILLPCGDLRCLSVR